MKNLTKNFIAFTLSEMMIVLLILSVISAATLPAITQRNEVKPRVTNSIWSYDYARNKGYFYKAAQNPDSTDVIIGFPTLENATAGQKTTLKDTGKNASLRLLRPNYILNRVTDNVSSIAFFDVNGQYQGKIAKDKIGNLAIGNNVLKDPHSKWTYNSIYIGQNAAWGLSNSGYNSSNVVVGYGAAGKATYDDSYSYLGQKNVVIAPNSGAASIGSNNVIIGAFANRNSHFPTESTLENVVAIGYRSIGFGTYSVSSVNVGYESGYGSSGSFFNDAVNIGQFAGAKTDYYTQGVSGINLGYLSGSYAVLYGNSVNVGYYSNYASNGYGVNLGAYAGAYNQYSTNAVNIGYYAGVNPKSSSSPSVNIGYYAGYGNRQHSNIHIGYFAGMYSSDNNNIMSFNHISIGRYAGYDSDLEYSVAIGDYAGYMAKDVSYNFGYSSTFIGRYAGYSSSYGSVIIGCYGLKNISSNKKMCIGGVYPSDSSYAGNSGTIWKPSDSTVATLITPYTGSNWERTGIYLLAKNVVSFGGTLTAFSDRTLKENIVKTKYGIDKLRQVNIYQYNFKGEKDTKIGVIAQELQKVYPEAVSKASSNYLTVNSDWIIYSMVQALKDVDNAVINLQNELSVNLHLVKKLSVKICSLESKLNRLSKNNKDNQKLLAEIDVILSKMERK